jgi:hypothetical protein
MSKKTNDAISRSDRVLVGATGDRSRHRQRRDRRLADLSILHDRLQ